MQKKIGGKIVIFFKNQNMFVRSKGNGSRDRCKQFDKKEQL
jgi:hypothetical protein